MNNVTQTLSSKSESEISPNDNNKKDDVKKKKVVKRQASVNYDYNFAGEGDNKRKNFNFAAVGDFLRIDRAMTVAKKRAGGSDSFF